MSWSVVRRWVGLTLSMEKASNSILFPYFYWWLYHALSTLNIGIQKLSCLLRIFLFNAIVNMLWKLQNHTKPWKTRKTSWNFLLRACPRFFRLNWTIFGYKSCWLVTAWCDHLMIIDQLPETRIQPVFRCWLSEVFSWRVSKISSNPQTSPN